MGLDNIPRIYPCEKAGTAVMDSREDGSSFINCQSTIACGGCVFKDKFENDPITKQCGPTYGLFGTPCWYRGKHGNALLHLAETNGFDSPIDFFGTAKSDDTMDLCLSPEESMELSRWMASYTEKFAHVVDKNNMDPRLLDDWMYASWWLKFTADYADGSVAWY